MASKALFDIPSGAVAQVHIIDTGVRMKDMPSPFLLTPGVDGFDKLFPLPAWCFLVESSTGQKALFDLSFPPDPAKYPPYVADLIKTVGVTMEGNKHVADVLREHNVDPAEIGSVIWSHHHFDHIGDITTFPHSTELVVGPGFKDAYYPGFPTQKDTETEERHFEGRNVREIDFSSQSPQLTAGAFEAFDFFGDGSFYLLNTPGHDIGHLAGLARTTSNPDTFIFMAGDICHHGGEFRPSPHVPIPSNVQYPILESIRSRVSVCPGAAQFHALNEKRGRKADEPFFDPVLVVDRAQTIQTIKESQLADARSDVLFIIAHDTWVEDTLDLFPLPANDWKQKGWREETYWKFLADLAPAVV